MRAWEAVKLGYDPSALMAGDTAKAINMSSELEVRVTAASWAHAAEFTVIT